MRKFSLLLMVCGVFCWVAPPADASTDATFVFGSLLGDDLVEIVQGDFSVKSTFEDATLYGGRFGWYGFPLGVEGSFVVSNSNLSVGEGNLLSLDSRIRYLEANALLLFLPGGVQPYVTGGGGVHDFALKDFDGAEAAELGWNVGFGVKVNVSRVAVRFDVRDHRTRFDPGEFGLDQEIINLLGLETVQLDNVEVSFGFALRF